MDRRKIIIGTRGSPLALAQAELVLSELKIAHSNLTFDIKIIKTSGDNKLINIAANENLDKGMFTKEIEEKLLCGEIDIAVHSLKDLNIGNEESLKISAVLKRSEINDIIISKKKIDINNLTNLKRIGTSSERRAGQISYLLKKHSKKNYSNATKTIDDFDVIKIRGNINTRIKKLEESQDLDAIILAHAGLKRLGLIDYKKKIISSDLNIEFFDPKVFYPAACQGIIAIQIRSSDVKLDDLLKDINHRDTFLEMSAERKLLELMGADCKTPIGIYSTVSNNKLELNLRKFSYQTLEDESISSKVFTFSDYSISEEIESNFIADTLSSKLVELIID